MWEAFTYLLHRRQFGSNGPNAISMEAIKAYTDVFNIETPYRRSVLALVIDELDKVWCEDWFIREKERREREDRSRKGNKQPMKR